MKRTISTMAAAALAAALGGSPAAADDRIKSWATAGWDGGSYQDPTTGEVYCLLWHEYGDGMEMQLGVDQLGYYAVLTDPANFEFVNPDPFDTGLQVDNFYPTEFEAYADNPDTLVIDLAKNKEFLQLLASGSRLTLVEWGNWFGLPGSADAIAALKACHDE